MISPMQPIKCVYCSNRVLCRDYLSSNDWNLLMFPVVNVITILAFTIRPTITYIFFFRPCKLQKYITCHLFKMVQFDFEEVNFESGLGLNYCYRLLLLCKNQPVLLKSITWTAVSFIESYELCCVSVIGITYDTIKE